MAAGGYSTSGQRSRTGGWFDLLTMAIAWFALDRASKSYFEAMYSLGQTSESDFVLFRFNLVHNTGAAWGIFDDATFILGVVSLAVCAIILLAFANYERLTEHAPTYLETFALALVFAGGLGNAVDRFMNGYVVDFIEFTFIDFPVFNVADIGVTCGFVLLILGYLLACRTPRD